ncbi:glycosyltransferase [Pontibacter sp. SGAir0037]|uniref:glycosyltransferase n=1 Tax=Pontibacter sp. SGAir0037 TaxID=2571030 RepID=UPI00143CDCF4|nr:glycosyltransferase [Pontibacter sp. SGAir0037]
MNIFVIPSWYPSYDYPLNGVFIKEQAIGICASNASINIGISLWGQKDKRYLLWAGEPLTSVKKLGTSPLKPGKHALLPNLVEYTKPAFTWTRKVAKGNIKAIIQANLYNIEAFKSDFGAVDLIQAHIGYPGGYIALELSRRLHIPYVLTEHMEPFPSPYYVNKQGQLQAFFKQAYSEAATVIAVGQTLAATIHSLGIPHIQVLPNFVEETFFKPHAAIKHTDRAFTFFTLGSIEPEKGIDQLLYAVQALPKESKALFRIGGTGTHLQTYKTLTSQLGISDKVHWLGEISRKAALAEYQQCDVFVLPSQHESMGIVYAEAIACGKPIISTRCGGPESIVTAQNGILVDKNNPLQLADAMQYMMRHIDDYDPSIIRKDFLARFSKQAVIPRLLRVYENAIATYKPYTT